MIPFDGTIDYSVFLSKLKNSGADLPMSLEVYMSKCDLYAETDCGIFVERAAMAGRRLIENYNSAKEVLL
jgi:sugar phosphate isomerase/epimerase